jgi:predicted nucleotidyltransferase
VQGSKRLPPSPLTQRLEARRDDVIAAIERYGGRNVRVFGSLARGDGTPESDLDLLVDLPPQTGILTLGRIARDVEAIMGLETEVVPTASLRAAVRDHVLAEAIPL